MISLIVAVDKNFLIGNGNKLPWHYSADLKYFKKLTINNAVLMGYNTYLSIKNRLGRALPNRINYCLTYLDYLDDDVIVVKDLEELLCSYKNSGELFIIGGKMIYEMLLDKADRLYITKINKEFVGDVYFPHVNFDNYIQKSSIVEGDLEFVVYERKVEC